nr:tRNA pseudouridine(55) synthase TruB [Gemmatimonadaceae bacterium]
MSPAARGPRPTVDGLLLLDKPAGISSHDAVLRARRATGERRIGHGGTLDPFATGLLVLLLGRATRLLSWMPGEPKVYDARIVFGRETDTDDLLGSTTREAPPPGDADVDTAIRTLTGSISQVPPAFSAKRVDGKRAYAMARAGEAVSLAPVPVVVHAWSFLERTTDTLDVRITCGGGTYIRALARDLGRLTGSAAHLTALRRVASGPFDVSAATSVDALADGAPVAPPLAALPHLARVTLTDDEVRKAMRGLTVGTADAEPGTRAALVD